MFFKLLKDWNGQKAGTQISLSDADAGPLVQAGILEPVRGVARPQTAGRGGGVTEQGVAVRVWVSLGTPLPTAGSLLDRMSERRMTLFAN